MSNPVRRLSGAESAVAARLLLAMVDDDHATADRVLAEADVVPLLKGLLAWSLALGDRASGGNRDRLRRLFAEQLAEAESGGRR